MKKTLMNTIGLLMLCLASTIMAKTLQLYDKPTDKSTIIGSIDSEKGIVPIFSSEDGKWVKVGDPKNGNTGWIKSDDLKLENQQGYSISEQIIQQGNQPPRMILQFGTPKPLTEEQIKAYNKQIDEKQKAMQKEMQRVIQEITTQFHDISKQLPLIMPIIVVPEENKQQKAPSKPTDTQQPTVKNP